MHNVRPFRILTRRSNGRSREIVCVVRTNHEAEWLDETDIDLQQTTTHCANNCLASLTQEDNKMKPIEPFFEHSSQGQSGHAEEKAVNKNVAVQIIQRPYNCEICLKKFSQHKSLKRHTIEKHYTGEKPFNCEFCFKQFSTTGHLQKHLRVHTETKSFNCEICSKQFNCASYLKRHSM
uniref:Zinc finger protein 233-like n=1 Tax=Diabrotica virgifera virgifera TaxID=50390 RepID=A0A6P7H1A9_DIAVI